jgi:hypothetical protein
MDRSDIEVEAKSKEQKANSKGRGVGSLLLNLGGLAIIILFALLIIGALGLGLYRMFFLSWVENYEQAYAFHTNTGKIELINQTGYVSRIPFRKLIHTVDTRPIQVCISTIQRTLNCKLVQFDPKGLDLFLSWHGRDNYSGGQSGNLNELLKNYAYDGTGAEYPFLRIKTELKNTGHPPSGSEPPRNVSPNNTEPAKPVEKSSGQ